MIDVSYMRIYCQDQKTRFFGDIIS